jgi:rhodanese-related sulfurtransferase
MKHLDPKEAHQFMQEHPDAVMIDCRSEMEFLFVGHPGRRASRRLERAARLGDQPALRRQVKKISSMNRPSC